MATTPLMPKATAVWLVENTALSFDQIADFCKLHPLEVKAIADGDAAQGIKGLDPILTGQLTREEITNAEADHAMRPAHVRPEGAPARAEEKEGPALHAGVAPPGPAERDPLAGAQSSRAEGRADHAPRRHHQVDHPGHPRTHALERRAAAAARSGDARPVHADRSRLRGAAAPPRKSRRSRIAARRCFRPPSPPPPRKRRPRPSSRPKQRDDLNVDAVFAKLKQLGKQDEKSGE